jgi:hypothetical protein
MMRPRPSIAWLLAAVLMIAAAALAAPTTAPRPPVKIPPAAAAANPELAGPRQAGDTIADAWPATVPFSATGSTCGYVDDYDEICPYDEPGSPDVVYAVTPPADVVVDIDLCGSSYDTKVYVYDADLQLLACNDDFYGIGDPCGLYVSKIEFLSLAGGEVVYVVVDGYGGACGDYVLNILDTLMCEIIAPPGAELEGEPPLEVDYVDCQNAGCSTTLCDGEWQNNWQPLWGDVGGELVLAGRSGWYTIEGVQSRDTDWFSVVVGPGGTLTATIDAERPVYLFRLAPLDCNDVTVVEQVTAGPCVPATLTVTGTPGSEVWLWVGPTVFTPPAGMDPDGDGVAGFDYLLELSGLENGPVAVRARSFSGIKALYR